MNGSDIFWMLILLAGIVVGGAIVLDMLSQPLTGNIGGYEVELPLIGWIIAAILAILAFVLYLKHRA